MYVVCDNGNSNFKRKVAAVSQDGEHFAHTIIKSLEWPHSISVILCPHSTDGESEVWYQDPVRDPLQGLKHIRVGFFEITRSLEVGGCKETLSSSKTPMSAVPLAFSSWSQNGCYRSKPSHPYFTAKMQNVKNYQEPNSNLNESIQNSLPGSPKRQHPLVTCQPSSAWEVRKWGFFLVSFTDIPLR